MHFYLLFISKSGQHLLLTATAALYRCRHLGQAALQVVRPSARPVRAPNSKNNKGES